MPGSMQHVWRTHRWPTSDDAPDVRERVVSAGRHRCRSTRWPWWRSVSVAASVRCSPEAHPTANRWSDAVLVVRVGGAASWPRRRSPGRRRGSSPACPMAVFVASGFSSVARRQPLGIGMLGALAGDLPLADGRRCRVGGLIVQDHAAARWRSLRCRHTRWPRSPSPCSPSRRGPLARQDDASLLRMAWHLRRDGSSAGVIAGVIRAPGVGRAERSLEVGCKRAQEGLAAASGRRR